MSKLLKDLVPGDIIYMLCEGTDHGLLHLYEYRVEKPFVQNEKIKEWWTGKLENYPFDIHITEEYLDKTEFGFLFTSLEDAKQKYLEKAEKILDELKDQIKVSEDALIEKYRWRSNILNTKEELEFAKSHEALYLSWIESGKTHFEPTKTYDIEEDDTNV